MSKQGVERAERAKRPRFDSDRGAYEPATARERGSPRGSGSA
ncbi:hypothetical protein [Halomarina oriensis]|nr:hypothetical protein [Halomarina oriensis]